MLRHFSRKFFKFLNKAIFLKNSTKNAKKVIFGQKITVFDFFGGNFQKYCLLIQKFEKKKHS